MDIMVIGQRQGKDDEIEKETDFEIVPAQKDDSVYDHLGTEEAGKIPQGIDPDLRADIEEKSIEEPIRSHHKAFDGGKGDLCHQKKNSQEIVREDEPSQVLEGKLGEILLHAEGHAIQKEEERIEKGIQKAYLLWNSPDIDIHKKENPDELCT